MFSSNPPQALRRVDTAHRRAVSRIAVLAVVICMSIAGFARAATTGTAISIHDAWIRWLPGNLPAGGYLSVTNGSDHTLSLVQASSADYAVVSLHQTRNTNGMSRMLPVKQIDIPPKSTLRFEGTGYHLMFEHPTRTLAPGDHVTVTLRFSQGPPRSVRFEVRQPSATGPSSSMPGMPGMSGMPGMGH